MTSSDAVQAGQQSENIVGTLRKRRATVKATPEYTKQKNDRLIRALKGKTRASGLETKQVAKLLDMQYSQLNACYAGVRDFAYLTPHQRQKVANFLGVPPIQIHLWCGLVLPTDFVTEPDYRDKIEEIYQKNILGDPMMAEIAPSEEVWAKCSQDMKLSYVLLFQSYIGSWLMTQAQAAMNPAQVIAKVKSEAKAKPQLAKVKEQPEAEVVSPADKAATAKDTAKVRSMISAVMRNAKKEAAQDTSKASSKKLVTLKKPTASAVAKAQTPAPGTATVRSLKKAQVAKPASKPATTGKAKAKSN